MVCDEMLDMMTELVNDPRFDDVCETYLEYAQDAVVSRLWPFDQDKTFEDVPRRFHARTVQIALYMLNKRGAEGETRHVENGTTHEWESSNVPESFFDGMVPMAGVI